jgi:hypothetical protein
MAKPESTHEQMLDQVRQEIAVLEDQLALLRAVEQYHSQKARGKVVVTLAPLRIGISAIPPTVSMTPSGKRFAALNQTDAAAEVLREAGRPLSTAEIAEALVQGGVRAKSPARLKASLFPAMQRKPSVFRKAGPGRWALTHGDSNGTVASEAPKVQRTRPAKTTSQPTFRQQVMAAVKEQWLGLDQLIANTGLSKRQIWGVLTAPSLQDHFERRERNDGMVEYRLKT